MSLIFGVLPFPITLLWTGYFTATTQKQINA